MAIEAKRGCGYRKVGGLYLCGEFIPIECDRLPLEVGHCPVCGAGIHFSRSAAEINPFRLWGTHNPCIDQHPCKVCYPADVVAFIMMVGNKYYTPESFMKEAMEIGMSKRIPAIPKKLKLGETVVYLAHPKAIEVKVPVEAQASLAIGDDNGQMRLLEAQRKPEYRLGVFCAFIPQRVEKLIRESEATEEALGRLRERGITPITVPDSDPDHI